MLFGIPDILDYLFLATVVAWIGYIFYVRRIRSEQRANFTRAMDRTTEVGAQAHADAERIITLLTAIRDELARR